MNDSFKHGRSEVHASHIAMWGTAAMVTAGLIAAAQMASGWIYLTVNALVIVGALLLAAFGWLKSQDSDNARTTILDVAGIAALIGFAGLLVYEWDYMFPLK